MTLLIIGIVVFLGIHLLPAFPQVRAGLVGRIGENGYKALFSVLSIAGLVLLVWGFAQAPVIQVWSPPPWTRWVAIVLMLPAFIFLVAAYVPCRLKAKLKHPFLAAIKTWALAHMIANGDLASIILFGSFLAYAVFDRIALRGRQPTALVETPGSGPARNDLIAVGLGVVLYVVFMIWLHPLLIGRAVIQH
ncbi:MAG TPA: NnrU family protein [Methyloceanibacter sp.]|nr:NnrU family protein [Methyloceanibacter sp.]